MNEFSRRKFLGFLGAAIAVGATHGIFGRAAELSSLHELFPILEPIDPKIERAREAFSDVNRDYCGQNSMASVLKELYEDNTELLKDLVYSENPILALLPKQAGLLSCSMPIPICFGVA